MRARERWVNEATRLLGTPVVEAVPVGRTAPDAKWLYVGSAVIWVVVTFLGEFLVLPGPTVLAYLIAGVPIMLLVSQATETRFAAQTAGGDLWMLAGSSIRPRPVAPIVGRLDPATVSEAEGAFGNAFKISGTTHRVPAWHRKRFEKMLAEARQQRPTG
jgi:hypothetical protein